jgi:hypothetical protein
MWLDADTPLPLVLEVPCGHHTAPLTTAPQQGTPHCVFITALILISFSGPLLGASSLVWWVVFSRIFQIEPRLHKAGLMLFLLCVSLCKCWNSWAHGWLRLANYWLQ